MLRDVCATLQCLYYFAYAIMLRDVYATVQCLYYFAYAIMLRDVCATLQCLYYVAYAIMLRDVCATLQCLYYVAYAIMLRDVCATLQCLWGPRVVLATTPQSKETGLSAHQKDLQTRGRPLTPAESVLIQFNNALSAWRLGLQADWYCSIYSQARLRVSLASWADGRSAAIPVTSTFFL
ncbi:hypothetical protein NDU88_006980 [Pleurodeles waltl]|uniref:Uncharacterized protein n=1 Tax=Pleurodeles waltl TaxID=8319 RepID=A0AAV7MEM2_PLEWA|nr:hypothetical protein NDU88_006980 [Pleurodeles waltl]